MSFLYEIHLHTVQASGCARSPGRDYIARYQDMGYSGIFVTDHFYNGYSAIDKKLPWDRWVNGFCRGYEDALNEGIRRGFDVFFGWEETIEGDDYLVYGLDKKWLLDHPESKSWTRKKQFEEVKRCGGCIVQAHPFRQYDYIKTISLSLAADAVEAGNGGNTQGFDALAYRYSQKSQLPVVAGTDTHNAYDLKKESCFGTYTDNKLESVHDFINALRNDKKDIRTCSISGVKVPNGRFDLYRNERITLPAVLYDKHSNRININIKDFLEIK